MMRLFLLCFSFDKKITGIYKCSHLVAPFSTWAGIRHSFRSHRPQQCILWKMVPQLLQLGFSQRRLSAAPTRYGDMSATFRRHRSPPAEVANGDLRRKSPIQGTRITHLRRTSLRTSLTLSKTLKLKGTLKAFQFHQIGRRVHQVSAKDCQVLRIYCAAAKI